MKHACKIRIYHLIAVNRHAKASRFLDSFVKSSLKDENCCIERCERQKTGIVES